MRRSDNPCAAGRRILDAATAGKFGNRRVAAISRDLLRPAAPFRARDPLDPPASIPPAADRDALVAQAITGHHTGPGRRSTGDQEETAMRLARRHGRDVPVRSSPSVVPAK